MQKDTKVQSGAINREAKLNQWQFDGWWWQLALLVGGLVVVWWRSAYKKNKFSKENCIRGA
jgi:hypothetical protein